MEFSADRPRNELCAGGMETAQELRISFSPEQSEEQKMIDVLCGDSLSFSFHTCGFFSFINSHL